MPSPFEILGVPAHADARALGRAFRALALQHHPDLHPNDPTAAGRFADLVHAYREARAHLRGEPLRPARPSGPPPARYRCAACGDGFSHAGDCQRCALPAYDSHAGPAPEVRRDPAFEARMAAFERREPSVPLDERIYDALDRLPFFSSAIFFALALVVHRHGPPAVAAMMLAFGLWMALIETHARVRSLAT